MLRPLIVEPTEACDPATIFEAIIPERIEAPNLRLEILATRTSMIFLADGRPVPRGVGAALPSLKPLKAYQSDALNCKQKPHGSRVFAYFES